MSRFPPLPYRQIHLDFHTSEAIENVGRDFDPDAFVADLQTAHVNSVTLFAQCHHGWCYYPTKVSSPHPNLARPDLLGEMITACRAADIQTPVYITVQWNEHLARTRPGWRVMRAQNSSSGQWELDHSAQNQLSSTWHSMCLSHREYWDILVQTGLEICDNYDVPGLFYDIVLGFECVCPTCLDQMATDGRDPSLAADRQANDADTAADFKAYVSKAIWSHHPSMRIFYNAGHIHKKGAAAYADYSHLELESLPTGFWGYDHFPGSAKYVQNLGFDFLGQTGKFHTSWGEFGGFKHPDALIYETAQMAAMGAKCLVGDQLHPSGASNADTYASIAPAYARIAQMEPYLQDAQPIADIAILAAEYFGGVTADRGQANDAGAVRMMLEMQASFTVIDPLMDFTPYRVLVLPDVVPVDDTLASKIADFVAQGGKVLFTGRSGLRPAGGAMALEAGITSLGQDHPFDPTYVRPIDAHLPSIPRSPSVAYAKMMEVAVTDATVLADARAPHFNRSFARFCSHQHAPDDVDAPSLGPAVTLSGAYGFIAFEVFAAYYDVGQPIYKYIVSDLLAQLLPDPTLTTTLPSAGRAVVNQQPGRMVLHLLYGGPQMRGRKAPDSAKPRVMEMIEDIPTLADVSATLRRNEPVSRVYDALSGEDIPFTQTADHVTLTVARHHIHTVVVIEDAGGADE